MQELQPPAGAKTSTITLEPPKPVAVVPQNEANQMVKLDENKVPELDKKVDEFVSQVLSEQVNTPAFDAKVNSIHTLGSAQIQASAQISNRMLDRPARSMNKGLFDDSPIAKSLTELRAIVEDLDPSKQNLSAPRKFLGFIPMGNKARDYFMSYQSSQSHINGIIESLYGGKDELLKDNASIEQEKVNMWELMQALREYAYVGKQIDEKLVAKISGIEVSDPEKARIIKEEMLFYVRQKNTDFLTQLAVNIQGYLALDMVRKNNLELIKGVDRATTTTVSALRTAVTVAQALTNQKLVLDQITALNATTSSLIESTSAMLKKQSGLIHEQASGSTIEVEKLQNAFQNIYDTMDSIADYKVNALESMQETVSILSTEVEKSQKYLDRARSEEVRQVAKEIDVTPSKITDVSI